MKTKSKKRMTKAQKGLQETYKVLNDKFEQLLLKSEREPGLTTQHLQNLFFSCMKSASITKSVEIGAYEAGFSLRCQKEHPEISSIAFEANPYVFKRFEDRAKKNGVDYRFTCVAGKTGEVSFTVPRDYKGLDKPGDHQFASLLENIHSETVESYNVKSVRLDNAINLNKDDRLALWIDVEGATEVVFSGATRSLTKTVMIFIEVERLTHWEGQWLDHDVFNYLVNLGFVPIARDRQSINQYNYIYLNSNLMDVNKYKLAHHRYLNGEGEFLK